MSHCPVCDEPVKDDFGLIECAGCGAQLIVHMDGTVEHQGENAGGAGPATPESTPPEAEVEFDFGDDAAAVAEVVDQAEAYEATQMRTMERPAGAANPGGQDLVPPVEEDFYGMPEDDQSSNEEPQKEFLGEPSGEEIHEEINEEIDEEINETAPEEQPAPVDDFPDFDGTDDQGPAPLAYNQVPSASSSSDLGDVASFGNSESSGGREGPFRYNLFIEGIDTVDVREAFREALTDRKLMWDIDQILRSVKNGNVNIPNVAPTKAFILITRLRGMPVQVRWEQYAISQS